MQVDLHEAFAGEKTAIKASDSWIDLEKHLGKVSHVLVLDQTVKAGHCPILTMACLPPGCIQTHALSTVITLITWLHAILLLMTLPNMYVYTFYNGIFVIYTKQQQ